MTLLSHLLSPVLAAGALLTAPQVRETATFVFGAVHETTAARLYLSEVASCTGTGTICDEAYSVDLGASPEPGRSVFLHPEKVRALLNKEWPDADLMLEMTKPVKITATAEALDEVAVLAALRARLEGPLEQGGKFAVTVERVQVPGGLRLRPGEIRLEVEDVTDADLESDDWILRHLVGSQRFTMHGFEGEGTEPLVTFTATASLALRQKLPVALHDLDRGHTLRKDDLEERWQEVGRGTQRSVALGAMLTGRRLKRQISAGMPIPEGATEIPEIIKKGQLVRLHMKGRGMSVSGQVQALGSGGYGATIDALYPATKKRLKVRIVDASTVEYLF